MKVTKMGGPRRGLHLDGWPKMGTSPRWVAQDGDFTKMGGPRWGLHQDAHRDQWHGISPVQQYESAIRGVLADDFRGFDLRRFQQDPAGGWHGHGQTRCLVHQTGDRLTANLHLPLLDPDREVQWFQIQRTGDLGSRGCYLPCFIDLSAADAQGDGNPEWGGPPTLRDSKTHKLEYILKC